MTLRVRMGESQVELLDLVRASFDPKKYSNFRELPSDGDMRTTILADWGPAGQTMLLKVDKEPTSPTSLRARERGINTATDLQNLAHIQAIESPEAHNLTSLVDYTTLYDGRVVTVEPYFKSDSLRKRVAEKPLTLEEFEVVLPQVLEADRYLVNTAGMVHRDLHPGNVLVQGEGRNIRARVTDLENAKKITDLEAKIEPTGGARNFADPTLFFDKERKYGVDCDMFSLGALMFYALTGKHIVHTDPDAGTVSVGDESLQKHAMSSDPNLLGTQGDFDGQVDNVNYHWYLANAMKELPKEARKYHHIIHRCLIASGAHEEGKEPDNVRYQSLDQLVSEFEEVKGKKGLMARLLSPVGKAIAATTLGLSLVFGGVGYLNHVAHEQQLQDEARYDVKASWNGEGMHISNNLFGLRTSLTGYNKKGAEKQEKYDHYPQDRFLHVTPGGKISGSIVGVERPWPNQNEPFQSVDVVPGLIYIEGYEPQETGFNVLDHDRSRSYGSGAMGMGTGGYNMVTIEVPEDIPHGVHILAVEAYAPKSMKKSKNGFARSETWRNSVQFERPGQIIYRERIPLVVGDVPEGEKVDVKVLKAGSIDSYLGIETANPQGGLYNETKMEKGIQYEMRVPELGVRQIWEPDMNRINGSSFTAWNLDLPRGTDTTPHTMQIVGKKDGKVVYSTYTAIAREHINDDMYWWGPAIPDKDFAEKIRTYEDTLMRESQE